MIRFDQFTCADLAQSLRREWLETNGLGGFASGTVAGIHTRRYHGLLTAATQPPVGRVLLLAKYEETLVIGGSRFELGANAYTGAIHPRGFESIKEFRLDPFPVWIYQVDGVEIEKRVFMVDGEQTTVVEYELRSLDREPLDDVAIELRPLIAFRDYHSTAHANDAIDGSFERSPDGVRLRPYADRPELFLVFGDGEVDGGAGWYFNFEYAAERERGLDDREDLFNPCVIRLGFGPRASTRAIIASTVPQSIGDVAFLRESEIGRRARLADGALVRDPLVEALTVAADQYIASRGDTKTILAGYPWFTDWGRDTMIALPGLTLAAGRPEIARSVLETFAASVSEGMLPNRFPDGGETPEYNTVDATLWFFEAARAYVEHTGDWAFAKRLYPVFRDIVNWHMKGTRHGIVVDSDGLLQCGAPGVQLTWMDAKIGDWVVTPRSGKPVEVQALWYNALRIASDWARRFGDLAMELSTAEVAELARHSFIRQFWNTEAGCLYDVVDGDRRDTSMRPNQIIAISLANTMLPPAKARQVVDAVERDLLTPVGLRSLAPGSPDYRARYEGGVWDRDSSYHQGTVWPWLMGPFITAYLSVHGRSSAARRKAEDLLRGFAEHLADAGLGHVSEIADAEAPYTPRGCYAQAWSVAELLRAAVDLWKDRPPVEPSTELSSAGSTILLRR